MEPDKLVYTIGDAHIYENHIEQTKTQLQREPYDPPKLYINKQLKIMQDIENMDYNDVVLENYQHHPRIKAPIAV